MARRHTTAAALACALALALAACGDDDDSGGSASTTGTPVQTTTTQAPTETEAQKPTTGPARLYFYDWEANVVGPGGKTNATDPDVTGGVHAGRQNGLTLYEAVERAAKRPEQKDADNTKGQQVYLVDRGARTVLTGPAKSRNEIGSGDATNSVTFRTVKPGTVIVKSDTSGLPAGAPDRYFVLNDDPALSHADIKNPEQHFDPANRNEPIVTFEFTDAGKRKWEAVTRTIARRGKAAYEPPIPPEKAYQHFAIALDDELVSVPFIDFQANPDGISAENGTSIAGGFTINEARSLAERLKAAARP